MFKPFTKFFTALVAVLVIAGCSETDEPQKGVQYEALPTALTEFNLSPITEIFSLNCGHCRQAETDSLRDIGDSWILQATHCLDNDELRRCKSGFLSQFPRV